MKSLLTIILLLFSGFWSPIIAQPPQPSLLNCDNIDPLLHTLANLYPKQKCRPCDDPKTETSRECFDHEDNDEDGKTDCEDPDCLKDKRIQQRCRMMSRRKPQVKNKQ
jgi:hypothetical protein